MPDRIDVIAEAAKKAGEEMLKHDPDNVNTSVKVNAGDFVTEADLACEKIIEQTIKSSFPDDLVITEETADGHVHLTTENLPSITAWVVDPIDGTYNFKRGFDYSAVSIGYIEKGEITLAAAYNPFRDELYLAQKSKGATRNGMPIKVSDITVFDAGTGVSTSNTTEADGTLVNMSRYKYLGHVRVDLVGSAVLAMTDVASGRRDLYHHIGLKPWDNAAAFLIAQEAGAKLTDMKGNPVSFLSNEVVVGNPALVDEFVKRIK